MKMQYMYAMKSILLTSCLFISALSSAQQPPTTKPKPTDALGPQTAAAKCLAVGEVLNLLGQKKLFEQTAESFLPTVAEQLKLSKDETISLSASEKSRTLSFAPASSDWLNSGEANYRVLSNGSEFRSLTLDINKNCFSSPKEMIALAISTVGKGSKAVKLDDSHMLIWGWKDPDINMMRVLEIDASPANYSIAVRRDPDNSGAGG